MCPGNDTYLPVELAGPLGPAFFWHLPRVMAGPAFLYQLPMAALVRSG
ncbi:hypothetical protein Z946_1996 [Sulfitobacter noctilucicola]|nr:hypothetical protein Z946_1996 [Sulfitobacter noctilucicola]